MTYGEAIITVPFVREHWAPRFELLDPERYNRITVQTQRGCPFLDLSRGGEVGR